MPSGLTYTLTNLQDDIKGYTEVGDTVFSTTVLNKFIEEAREELRQEKESLTGKELKT